MLIAVAIVFMPSAHIYNVMAFALLIYLWFFGSAYVEALFMVMFMIGMVTGYAILFTITSIYFSAPDDSTFFYMLPAQKYLLQGRGHEAVMLTGIGGLIGIGFLVFVVGIGMPLMIPLFRALRDLFAPHLYWIIGLVIVFILMTEWPKDFGTARTPWGRVKDGWATLIPGYVTFILASILGMIIFYRTIIPVNSAFQGLMPVFVGLFAVPAILVNIVSIAEIPRQHISKSIDVSTEDITRGAGAGIMGGMFGAFIPAVTPGPAGLLAGHATAQRGDKMFIISMGATRVIYYVGAVMLFFLPMVHLRRGGCAININLFFAPETVETYYILTAAIAISGLLSFILLIYLSKAVIKLITRFDYRRISVIVLFVIIAIVYAITSWQGLLIMCAATAIGLIPVTFQSRRLNCLAVLLTPLFLNMAGLGPTVAGWLGLL
jgi:putative membrane protein